MCAGLSISSQERYSLSLVTDTRLRSGRRTINVARLWTLHGDDWVDEYAPSALTAPRHAESLSQGVKGIDEEPSQPLEFSRRYLDQNRNTVRSPTVLAWRRS